MEITEVRVKLVERSSERLRAFCSITLDGDFVIRDLKIIDGSNGAFVAMPSRKLADRCTRCGCKNHLRAKHCNECGQRLNENRAPKDVQGRAKLHADVAHPINAACRERIQNAVIEAFQAEIERAKSPDYMPPKYDDFDEDAEDAVEEQPVASAPKPAPAPVPVRKPPAVQAAEEDEGGFEDYNTLIADLKREAADRRDKHDEKRGWRPEPAETRSTGDERFSDAEPEVEKPQQQDKYTRPPAPPPPPRAPSPPPPPPPPPPKRHEEEHDDFGAGL